MEPEKTKSWIYKCLSEKSSAFQAKSLDQQEISHFTDEFLLDLRTIFEHFVKAFNELKQEEAKNPSSTKDKKTPKALKTSVFLYDLADKKGFMLFRQGYRLIFSSLKPGRVRVQFFKQKPFSPTEHFVDTFINAITNETLSINWVHEKHKGFVDIQILARYYMRRFLQEI